MSRNFYFSLLLPLIIPPLVFSICALAAGLSLADTSIMLYEQYSARKQNLLVCGLLGYFPIILLLAGLWLHRRAGGTSFNRQWMAWGGLAPILLVLIWVNFEYWPSFLPDRKFLGFPHGLEFIIGPGFFAPIGMVLGMGMAWWAARSQPTNHAP